MKSKSANRNRFTLRQLAELTSSELVGNPDHEIFNAAPLNLAGPHDVSFLANPKHQPIRYLNAMKESKAGAIFISPDTPRENEKNYLLHKDPSLAFQTVLEKFYDVPDLLTGFQDIHPSAVIHDSVQLGKKVIIGPNAVIDKDAKIGDGTFIGAGVYIGPNSSFGEECTIHANATIRENCHIGNRVIIQPGAVIGSCGFGYTQDNQGRHTKLKHFGAVVIEDDVEIGANSTVDRGRFTETLIGTGTKIDNLVQIAHNVQIGRHTLIMAQVGIAGSAKIGNHVILAGQTGVTGHIEVCDQVLVAAKSGITKSITKPGKYGGASAMPLQEYNRSMVHLKNLDKIIKKLK